MYLKHMYWSLSQYQHNHKSNSLTLASLPEEFLPRLPVSFQGTSSSTITIRCFQPILERLIPWNLHPSVSGYCKNHMPGEKGAKIDLRSLFHAAVLHILPCIVQLLPRATWIFPFLWRSLKSSSASNILKSAFQIRHKFQAGNRNIS